MCRNNLKQARLSAGLTQQQLADKLHIGLRHYQKIEYAEIGGAFEIWDALEDTLGIHQRILRETADTHRDQEESRQEH